LAQVFQQFLTVPALRPHLLEITFKLWLLWVSPRYLPLPASQQL